jgi:hypothetical protein
MMTRVLWARTVLWLILAATGLGIVVTLIFNLGYGMVTGDNPRDLRVDEPDRVISIQGMHATLVVAAAGFIGALGVGLLTELNLTIAALALGDLVGRLIKLAVYRRGV